MTELQRKDLFETKLSTYLETYIFPDVFIILDPMNNRNDLFHLAFSDADDQIIYETEITIPSSGPLDFDGLKEIGSRMKEDERYVIGTIFQELADALCMYQGIFNEFELITIINNYLPYFDELPDHSSSANRHMNSILASAIDIQETASFLCCLKNKCILTDSLYTWLLDIYQSQTLLSDSEGIWIHHSGSHLCPVFLHPNDTQRVGDIISVTREDLLLFDLQDPEQLNLFMHFKYNEYMKEMHAYYEEMEKMV